MIIIREIFTGIFSHEIEGKLIISTDRDLAVINNTVIYSSNEISASEKIENVKIYDLEGNDFTFISGQDLINKLYELEYFL